MPEASDAWIRREAEAPIGLSTMMASLSRKVGLLAHGSSCNNSKARCIRVERCRGP